MGARSDLEWPIRGCSKTVVPSRIPQHRVRGRRTDQSSLASQGSRSPDFRAVLQFRDSWVRARSRKSCRGSTNFRGNGHQDRIVGCVRFRGPPHTALVIRNPKATVRGNQSRSDARQIRRASWSCGGNLTTKGSSVLTVTQLKLRFARRREDGFEVPCAPEHSPTRVIC